MILVEAPANDTASGSFRAFFATENLSSSVYYCLRRTFSRLCNAKAFVENQILLQRPQYNITATILINNIDHARATRTIRSILTILYIIIIVSYRESSSCIVVVMSSTNPCEELIENVKAYCQRSQAPSKHTKGLGVLFVYLFLLLLFFVAFKYLLLIRQYKTCIFFFPVKTPFPNNEQTDRQH